MRKRRVIIFDHDMERLSMMMFFFGSRGGYEILTYQDPVICPIWSKNGACSNGNPCADIIIAGFSLSKTTGAELFRDQSHNGCKVSTKNKALLLGTFDGFKMSDIIASGSIAFEEPIDFHKLTSWIAARERVMDLTRPLKINRKEKRYESKDEVAFVVQPNNKHFKGTAVNISNSGLCLKADTLLRHEQAVTVHPGTPDTARVASVRWSVKIDNGSYMMGLQYM